MAKNGEIIDEDELYDKILDLFSKEKKKIQISRVYMELVL